MNYRYGFILRDDVFNFADHDPHKVLGRPPDVVDRRFKAWKLADGGCVVASKNAVSWHNKNGRLHRLDGPAVIHVNGTEEWFKDGLLDRSGL